MGYLLLQGLPNREHDRYRIRSVRPSDAEPIRQWRNAQIQILRQKETLSYEDQQRYFFHVVRPDFRSLEPSQILLMLIYERTKDLRELVGYGGLTHIDWRARSAELSFLTDARRKGYSEDFLAFLSLLRPLAFGDLDLQRIWHETYARSSEHVNVLLDFGFQQEGRLRNHVAIDGTIVDSWIYGLLVTDRTDS